jgi:hypothetical protein
MTRETQTTRKAESGRWKFVVGREESALLAAVTQQRLVKTENTILCAVSLYFPVAPTLEHRASVKRSVSLQFLNPKTVDRTPWTRDQPVARPLPTQTQNKRRYTSMPSVAFEPTISAFARVKTVHVLDHAANCVL